jgi:1,4-alpha-glucan branching enzyme
MHDLARRWKDGADDLTRRALNQAARELLLAQSSDWAFIMKTATAVKYAVDRVKTHLARFRRIDRELTAGWINAEWLADLESRDNIFPTVDYRVYA